MLNKLRDEIHQNAQNHGWWDENRTFGEIIALCHSELSEALEEYRDGKNNIYCYPCVHQQRPFKEHSDSRCTECLKAHSERKPEGIAIELSDCIIRILDYCGHAGIDIEEAIRIKHEHNKTRPYKHGGKKI